MSECLVSSILLLDKVSTWAAANISQYTLSTLSEILPYSWGTLPEGTHPTGWDTGKSHCPYLTEVTQKTNWLLAQSPQETSLDRDTDSSLSSSRPVSQLQDNLSSSYSWWEKKCVWNGTMAKKKIYYLQTWNHLLRFLHFFFQMVLLFQKLLLPWILQIWPRVPYLPLRLEMRFCLFWKREQLNVVTTDKGAHKRLAPHKNCLLSTLAITNKQACLLAGIKEVATGVTSCLISRIYASFFMQRKLSCIHKYQRYASFPFLTLLYVIPQYWRFQSTSQGTTQCTVCGRKYLRREKQLWDLKRMS